MLDINADQGAVGVIVKDHTIPNLVRIHRGTVGQVDVERVGRLVVRNFHEGRFSLEGIVPNRPLLGYLPNESFIPVILLNTGIPAL